MASELIYNISSKPLFVSHDGRSLIIQPKNNGTWAYQRFGVTDEDASPKEIASGLFFEDSETGRKHKVVPREDYKKSQHRKIRYGDDPEKSVTVKRPVYCQIPLQVSDVPQDGCAEVPATIASFACSAEFERRNGARCYRGVEIAKQLRAENASLEARNQELLAKERQLAELEAKLAASEKKAAKA